MKHESDSHSHRSNHPAMYAGGLFTLVVVSRISETLPFLSALPLGDISAAISLLLLVLGDRDKLTSFFATSIGKLMLAFGVLVILSGFYSLWPGKSLQFVMSSGLIIGILVMIVVKTSTTISHIRWFAWTLIWGGVAFVVNGVFASSWGGRVAVDSAYDPNDLALFLVVVLPLVLVELSLATSKLRRGFLAGLAALLGLLAILTQSRGGFLALLVVMTVLFFSDGFRLDRRERRFGVSVKRVGIIAIGVAFIVYLAPSEVWDRFGTIFNISDDYNVVSSREGRLAIWKRGIDYLLVHPWGAGVGAFPFVDSIMGGQFRTAHNSFVQVAVETGFAGIVVLLLILRTCFSSLGRIKSAIIDGNSATPSMIVQYAYSQGLSLSLLGFCVGGLFLSQGYSPLLYVLIAMIAANLNIAQRNGLVAPPYRRE